MKSRLIAAALTFGATATGTLHTLLFCVSHIRSRALFGNYLEKGSLSVV